MPTSVLEAMAFGLPVITRPVGGLVDFFENDKMGYLIESLNPLDYAQKIDLLINDIEKANAIANYNMEYAHEYFLASKVARQLEKILSKI
jgi:glycosyltransferase involved in cell wall biosynthesis